MSPEPSISGEASARENASPAGLSATQLQSILDSIPTGVITVDPDWRVTSINPAARRLLDLTEEEALGRLCRKVIHADGCIGECALRSTLETGQSVYDYEITCRPPNRPVHRLAVTTAVLRDPKGEPVGGVIAFRSLENPAEAGAGESAAGEFHGMVGQSRVMRELFAFIRNVAEYDSTVLIQGESGTGKELVARAIQSLSPRRGAPYIRVNCASFAESLLETELFGHVRGAFTDAHRDRPGRFELADGGTIFLDEVGEASAGVQLRLLRVLQEQEFERVGGCETVRVDVRVVAATHRPLLDLVRQGRFREDLFYRLNVIPIQLPALRDRSEDIPALARRFLEQHAVRGGRSARGFSPRAMATMLAYAWPGNVRELENAVEHAWVRARGSLIRETHLPTALRACVDSPPPPGGIPTRASGTSGAFGIEEILAALQATRWNRADAAERLGISRTTLWRRMADAGLCD